MLLPLEIPETKPATEFVNGRLLQKVGGGRMRSRGQGALNRALTDWAEAGGRGRVGPEWDFDLTPPGERTNRLVPDVAYLSYDRVAYEDVAAAEVPCVAPNVAVEILSAGQTVKNSSERVRIYLACGTELVILVEPRREYAVLIDAQGHRRVERDGVIEHPALPGFSMPLARAFTDPPPKQCS